MVRSCHCTGNPKGNQRAHSVRLSTTRYLPCRVTFRLFTDNRTTYLASHAQRQSRKTRKQFTSTTVFRGLRSTPMSAAVITSTVFFLAWIASEIGVRQKHTEVDMDQTRSVSPGRCVTLRRRRPKEHTTAKHANSYILHSYAAWAVSLIVNPRSSLLSNSQESNALPTYVEGRTKLTASRTKQPTRPT